MTKVTSCLVEAVIAMPLSGWSIIGSQPMLWLLYAYGLLCLEAAYTELEMDFRL